MACSSCKKSKQSSKAIIQQKTGPGRARSIRQALDRLKTRKAITQKRIDELENELQSLEGPTSIQSPFDEVLKD